MKKSKYFSLILAVFLAFAAIFGFAGCAEKDDDAYKEMLYDPNFQTGFKILGLDSRYDGNTAFGYIDYEGSVETRSILWRLAQWGTKASNELGASIDSGETGQKEGDFYVYENAGKRVKVDPEKGEMLLKVNGDKEYDSPRIDGQAWPHLLIEQNIPLSAYICDMEELILSIDFELTESENHMTKTEYNPNLHSAQFQWIFTVQNENPQTLGMKHDYFWFNVGYYDARYDYPPRAGHFDGGKADATTKYIYGMDSQEYLSEPVQVGNRMKVEFDVLPYIKSAFEEAQSKGAMAGTTFEELTITTTNIGWEVTGTYTVEVYIHDLSMKYKLKDQNS